MGGDSALPGSSGPWQWLQDGTEGTHTWQWLQGGRRQHVPAGGCRMGQRGHIPGSGHLSTGRCCRAASATISRAPLSSRTAGGTPRIHAGVGAGICGRFSWPCQGNKAAGSRRTSQEPLFPSPALAAVSCPYTGKAALLQPTP